MTSFCPLWASDGMKVTLYSSRHSFGAPSSLIKRWDAHTLHPYDRLIASWLGSEHRARIVPQVLPPDVIAYRPAATMSPQACTASSLARTETISKPGSPLLACRLPSRAPMPPTPA